MSVVNCHWTLYVSAVNVSADMPWPGHTVCWDQDWQWPLWPGYPDTVCCVTTVNLELILHCYLVWYSATVNDLLVWQLSLLLKRVNNNYNQWLWRVECCRTRNKVHWSWWMSKLAVLNCVVGTKCQMLLVLWWSCCCSVGQCCYTIVMQNNILFGFMICCSIVTTGDSIIIAPLLEILTLGD